MKLRALSSLSFVVLLSSIGCGGLQMQGGDPQTSNEAATSSAHPRPQQASVIPQESKDFLRKQEREMFARADEQENEVLDKEEKAALKALNAVLGKNAKTGPGTETSSTALKNLRAAKFKLRIESVTDQDGKAVSNDFVTLKDSFTDRVTQLQRKIAEGKASKKEMKEIQTGSKQVMRLNDLRMQVMDVSSAVMSSNNQVQSQALTMMIRASEMVRGRKQMEMELDAEDYKILKRGLEHQKRAEALAATTMTMLATYEAVVNDNGDPAALDALAEASLKAFPLKVEATDEEAKQYVAGLNGNVAKVKARYEADMRKLHGDAKYERSYKAGIDGMFMRAETAQTQKSATQMMNDTQNRYRDDVIKCKRGEEPGPGSLVGGCKAIRRAALTGDTSELPPGAKKVFDETGGANAKPDGSGQVQAKLGSRETAALNGAQAAANGDVDGVLDAGAKMFPGDTTIGASIQGLSALKKGDARGAINAALTFVPVPGLKDAFGIASKLLFKS